jgi:hypothetical protein
VTSLKKENCITNKSTCGIIPSSQATSGPPNVYYCIYQLPLCYALLSLLNIGLFLKMRLNNFKLKFQNFKSWGTSIQISPPVCLVGWFFYFGCICNSNAMVGITNIFSQAGSLILNNFDKYQRKFLLFLVRPLVNNLICFQHRYNTPYVLCIDQWASFFFLFSFPFFKFLMLIHMGRC